MTKKCKIIYIVSTARNYNPSTPIATFRTKKDAKIYCRKDSFKYSKTEDLFLGEIDGWSCYRCIETIEYWESYP